MVSRKVIICFVICVLCFRIDFVIMGVYIVGILTYKSLVSYVTIV
jgi:hypothetical protein